MRKTILFLAITSLLVSSCLAQSPCPHKRVFQDDGDSCLDAAPSPSAAIVGSILATKEAGETFSEMELSERANLPNLLKGLVVHLRNKQQEDMIVRGDFPLSGGDNTWFWIVTSAGSHPVVFWVQANSVTILRSQHYGYSDIRTDWAAGARSATRIFRHDDRGYRLFREDYKDLPPS